LLVLAQVVEEESIALIEKDLDEPREPEEF
jgi:hypothetical protein